MRHNQRISSRVFQCLAKSVLELPVRYKVKKGIFGYETRQADEATRRQPHKVAELHRSSPEHGDAPNAAGSGMLRTGGTPATPLMASGSPARLPEPSPVPQNWSKSGVKLLGKWEQQFSGAWAQVNRTDENSNFICLR